MTAEPDPNEPAALRILELGTQFGMGGITRHILSLSAWLNARGHAVTLGGTADIWGGPQSLPGFVELPTRFVAAEGGGLPARLWHMLNAAWRLRRWLARNPVDLIHTHESAPALVAQIARIGLRLPLIVTYHGSEPERIAAFGAVARRCNLVITPSHASASDLVSVGKVAPERVRVVGLGVPPAPADNAAEIAALRSQLLGTGTHVVVTVARLLRQKGVDILLDCAARIRSTHPGCRFVIVGDGPDEPSLRQKADELDLGATVTFAGRTERPHLYLRAADIFLLTSRWESLPFTIVEAFQAGTPVLATACSGVVELVDDSVGATAAIGDVTGICAQLAGLLDDADRRAGMAKAALARSREDRFRPDWVHAQLEAIYLDTALRP